jgi:hypothetical protein
MYTCGSTASLGRGLLTPFPIVVQHTRFDSRQAENALLSTVAYASND